MSWSHSQRSGFREQLISDECFRQTGMANCFVVKGVQFFYDINTKNEDAITGSVFREENGAWRKTGSFKIDQQGRVVRGPAFMKHVPMYIIHIKEPGLGWREMPTSDRMDDSSLTEFLKDWVNQYKPGGSNSHLESRYPTEIKVVDADTNGVVCEWKAGMFQVY